MRSLRSSRSCVVPVFAEAGVASVGSHAIESMSRCFKNSDGEQQFTEEEAKEHLAEFDENGDGKWSCEEFVTFCTETGDHGHSHLAMVKEVRV